MTQSAKLELDGKTYQLPVIVGTENEKGVDITSLRQQSGYITLDEGYRNTGSCSSSITFIDGEKGILRYRGIPIEQIAEQSTFIETAWLLMYGELPTREKLQHFRDLLREHEMIHEGLRNAYDGFPATGHPMAILSAMINALSCYHPDVMQMEDEFNFETAAARLLSKVRTIAAASYKTSKGEPIIYPRPELQYVPNFLHMMFTKPNKPYEPDDDIVRALNLVLILHADHEQNCSTSTVRMVASSRANMFASIAAGVCALWGSLHGGANITVINQLNEIYQSGIAIKNYIENIKKTKARLFGFGHGVYRNYDPRAQILKVSADIVLDKLGVKDPLLDIARQLEEVALNDPYFVDRKLYPNVDFYSGIILRAIGIPLNMFTVMFAIGRMPGWFANFKEVHEGGSRIYRPRQIYTGPAKRDYIPLDQRG